MRRLCLWWERMLVDHGKKVLLAYLAVAACVVLYPVCIVFKFTYFAVHIPDGLQDVFGVVGRICDNASLQQLIGVVKRQSISHEILSDFVNELPGMAVPVVILPVMMINREGFVPCFLKTWKRGVHWTVWMALCALAAGVVCFAAMETIHGLLSSPETFPPAQLVRETLRTDLAAAFEQVLVRRRALAICSVIHFATITGMVVLVLVIPSFRILWAPRYVAHGNATESGPAKP